jgi:hypothetical protein
MAGFAGPAASVAAPKSAIMEVRGVAGNGRTSSDPASSEDSRI